MFKCSNNYYQLKVGQKVILTGPKSIMKQQFLISVTVQDHIGALLEALSPFQNC